MRTQYLKTATAALAAGLMSLLSPAVMQGQIIPPVDPSAQLTPSNVMNAVRTAMIDFASPTGSIQQLFAIVHKSEITGTVELFLQTSEEYRTPTAPASRIITTNYRSVGNGGSHTSTPDVIIGHDLREDRSSFIVAVAYTEWNGTDYEVFLSRYTVHIDPLTDTISGISPLYLAERIGLGFDPSLDVLADKNMEYDFFDEARPGMAEFVMTYNQNFTFPQMAVSRNKLSDPMTMATTNTFADCSSYDVCAVYDIDLAEPFAYVVLYDYPSGDIQVKEINLDNWANSDLPLVNALGYHKFRIEGYSYGESAPAKPRWMTTGSYMYNDIHTYFSNGGRTSNIMAAPFTPDHNADPDVTAGLGDFLPFSGTHYGNNQYSFAWSRPSLPGYTDPGYYSNYIDNFYNPFTGGYLQVNNMPVTTANDNISCISISNSCNGGENMITAYNEGNAIFYKFTGPGYQFGPAGVRKLTNVNSVQLYPNPASDIITLTNLENQESIHLYNMAGKEILHRETKGQNQYTIDLSALPAGNYAIQVRGKTSTSNRTITITR